MKQSDKSEATYNKIMKVAIQEFGTHGYDGASLNRVCDTGISKGLVYHHFKNKDAVYLACVQQCFTAFTDFLKNQAAGADWQRYMDARLRFFRENTAFGQIFFEAILKPPKHLTAEILAARADFDAFNQAFCEAVLDGAALRDGVTKNEALSYFALMQTMFNGYFSSQAVGKMPLDDVAAGHENRLSKLLEFMLYGVVKKEDSSC